MYITFSEGFDSFTLQDWAPYQDALENLLQAHLNGWHVLVLSRAVARTLALNPNFSSRQKSVLVDDLLPRTALRFGELRAVPYSLTCVPDAAAEQIGPSGAELHLQRFADPDASMKSRLLVEHFAYDGNVLLHFTRAVAKKNKLRAPLNIEVLHGGGGDLAANYAACLPDVRPAVCIGDSDRSFVGGPIGETARSLMQHPQINQFGTVRYEVLACRELENLLPLSFLYEVYEDDPAIQQLILRFRSFCDTQHRPTVDSVLQFIDFKSGFTASKVRSFPPVERAKFETLVLHLKGAPLHAIADDETACFGISTYLARRTSTKIDEKPWLVRDLKSKFLKLPFLNLVENALLLLYSYGAGGRTKRLG